MDSLGVIEAGQVVALRLRLSDWYSLVAHVDTFRALWAGTRCKDNIVILDATVGHSFLAGYIPLQQHEAIRVAEMFSGGFCGWSQAAYCLREFGVKLRSTWFLDKDPAVCETMSVAHPGIRIVQGLSGFAAVDLPSEQAMVIADINDTWWHHIWTVSTPDMLAASPPCQPWSVAGKQGGLASPEGELFPLLARIAGFSQVPVVCVEEVQGFLTHPDAPAVLDEWKRAGYVLKFRQVVNLADVAPTQRTRLLMIFVHHEAPCLPGNFQVADWMPLPRPSWVTNKCYFPQLPDEVIQPCILSEETMAKYLDPWYLPPANARTCPKKFRMCSLRGKAHCFMAMYHRQHELPEDLLSSKGLLGSLLQTGSSARFFSAPEIATCHDLIKHILIPEQDHVAMQFLGNAIAVPHAIWAMAHSLQCFTVVKQVDPVESVHQAHHLRIKADACALLRIQHGWLLTSLKKLSSLLAHRSLRLQIESGLRVHNAEFHRVDVIPPDPELETLEIFFSAHLRPEEAIQAFGLSCDDTVQPEPHPSQQFVWTVTSDSAPVLRLPVGKSVEVTCPRLCSDTEGSHLCKSNKP